MRDIIHSGYTCNEDAVKSGDTPLMLWYNNPAPIFASEFKPQVPNGTDEVDEAWERWSLPIGNGYFGANIFGRTETERIQITEKTLVNPHAVRDGEAMYIVGGTNNFSETFIDFDHKSPTDYVRYLDIRSATAGVSYNYAGVGYKREYFVSYPDKALVIRLDADKNGSLSFTLRPTIPYKQSYGGFKGDGVSKSGSVTSMLKGDVGEIELTGHMGFYGTDFCGIYRVYTNGGVISASTVSNTYKDKDGTVITDTDGVISVRGANSAYIIATFGTDYELSSEVFTSAETDKPTKKSTLADARRKVFSTMSDIEDRISGKNYEEAYMLILDRHISDYKSLFNRVDIDLSFSKDDIATSTDKLVENYRLGRRSAYLEALFFQYGRYLLISSSREGALPANLQGVWNSYNTPAWACDYTHNINVEMNYWPAFSTNLAETFKAYTAYNSAYMKQAEIYADELIEKYNPKAYGKDGGNGWVLGDHTTVYKYSSHRSAGNIGFMTQVFWDYYSYTKDPEILRFVYRLLANAARYITKCIEPDESGKYLVQNCDSPEMYVNGVWYYTTGTTYAQTFAYLNNYNALMAAKELGIDLTDAELLSKEEYSVLNTILSQIDRYDPINVGLSGQIKEFREEDYYCSIGDEYRHRHVAQLVGLHPGDLINANTPAWLDAAEVSLTERGDAGTGWSVAWKINLWARLKNGSRAYALLFHLLKTAAFANLWTQHPPFQIDASFGATAGIAEMLLQSHEGCIAPLAALPETWQSGSFSGLMARGNFEVAAEWKNGTAKVIRITSKSGGIASVRYPSAACATVKDSDGRQITACSCGNDLISFETRIGKTYTISGFIPEICPKAPCDLKLSGCNEGTELSWNASPDAVAYNVYIAIESDPAYTLIGNTSETKILLSNDTLRDDQRVTFAVTAVSKSGAESKRTLAYRNPCVVTEYGVIPADSSDIPFAYFAYQGGEYRYMGSYHKYSEAVNALGTLTDSFDDHPPVIYVVKNAVVEDSPSLYSERFIIDLGARSLVLNSPLFNVDAAYTHAFFAKVKSGRLLTANGSVLEMYSSSVREGRRGKCLIEFEGIIFGRERYCERTAPIFILKEQACGKGLKIDIRLSDCTVDYISNKETEPTTLFDFAEEKDGATATVTIRGTSIKLQSLRTLPLFRGKSDLRIVFAMDKSSDTAPFKLTDTKATDLIFTTDIGNCVLEFVKRERVHYTVYTYYRLTEQKGETI